MVDVAESVGPVDRLHNLLLAMTGRVDDDAVNSVREMLGIGQLDAAAEFLTGCLLAGRIPVNATEQYHLRRVLDEARSEHGLADRLHVVEALPSDRHRFSDQDESDADLVQALGPIAGRLGGVRALWCAWRVTPAGVTYGAVPQRVLLVEVGQDGSVAAAGYQLLEALRRAGIGCSVEVFASGADLPEYHRNALASSRRVHLDMAPVASNRNGANRARAPRVSSGGDSAGSNDLPSEPAALVEPEPQPAVVEAPSASDHTPTPATGLSAAEVAEAEAVAGSTSADGSKNMRVPAAVDAKLTDRERNLLRKLHEELAQREQDRDGKSGDRPQQQQQQQETWTTTPGTGGFPPIGAGPAPANNQAHGQP